MSRLTLKDGSCVVVIGGGPAGASCAIKLKNESKRVGMDLKVILYEGKNFDFLYNQCVGVLSPPFQTILENELNIELPTQLINRKIAGYCLHGTKKKVILKDKEHHEPTYVVRRIEFDNFMLSEAKKVGVEVIQARVTYVEFVKHNGNDEVRIFGERGYQTADAVVGAFGLDEAMLGVFEKMTPKKDRYHRPKRFLRSYITKIFTDKEFINERFEDIIYAFIPSKIPSIEFGAITPKDDYIMVNIAGKDVRSPHMDAFLRLESVQKLLPDNFCIEKLDFFEGMFPTSPARNAYGHRFVCVGDSTGWMRPFKGKGINTAFITGIEAAKAMIYHGICKDSFLSYERKCHVLREDYYFGTFARYFTHFASWLNIFDSIIDMSTKDEALNTALFHSVSGHENYKTIIKEIANVKTAKRVLRLVYNNFRLKT